MLLWLFSFAFPYFIVSEPVRCTISTPTAPSTVSFDEWAAISAEYYFSGSTYTKNQLGYGTLYINFRGQRLILTSDDVSTKLKRKHFHTKVKILNRLSLKAGQLFLNSCYLDNMRGGRIRALKSGEFPLTEQIFLVLSGAQREGLYRRVGQQLSQLHRAGGICVKLHITDLTIQNGRPDRSIISNFDNVFPQKWMLNSSKLARSIVDEKVVPPDVERKKYLQRLFYKEFVEKAEALFARKSSRQGKESQLSETFLELLSQLPLAEIPIPQPLINLKVEKSPQTKI